ncbi:type IV secretion system protein VirD4 [Christensenella hongkongensis]|uniref:TrsK-like protein n=1 Tax=Christensenella hongkongensis TaxID=270498 RepID=A0A0M2NLR1_9FIRM|nr:type IV secretory system conjugative DNA transfer family protein [Christensenella hongkongensis]KKI51916.1 TrsK-like protein [Christensenella hongkongensis]TCW24516.1 type IV secretion system protein VirD4 [Christensenella hongkongensis]
MNPNEDWNTRLILIGIGCVFVVWAAVIAAPFLSNGLIGIIRGLAAGMAHPFRVAWCDDTPRAILIFLLIYGLCIGIFLSARRNYRRGEEYGSAKLGDARSLSKKYADKTFADNIILTQNTRIGLDGRRHRRNLNVLVVGGSGAGKTRFYAKPNIMQGNTSFVVLDCKGEILRDTGKLLEQQGYIIRVLDFINMEKSHGYNPFAYLRDEKDVLKLVNNLIRNTTPKGSNSNDPFWERAETALLEALILYLRSEAPPEEQNFPMVMEMLAAAEVREEDEEYASVLDELFERLAMRDPDHLAVKQYHIFKMAAGKTAKSILVSLGVRLEKFNIPQIASLVTYDELDLPSVGKRKTALFALIPDNDSSLNFIIGMMYTQLFQELFYLADREHGGQLPVHVHCMMDEFANVALPDEFDKLLATMRSREVSVSIILQNIAQLKALFEKQWESIIGNCDEFLFLGGNERATRS